MSEVHFLHYPISWAQDSTNGWSKRDFCSKNPLDSIRQEGILQLMVLGLSNTDFLWLFIQLGPPFRLSSVCGYMKEFFEITLSLCLWHAIVFPQRPPDHHAEICVSFYSTIILWECSRAKTLGMHHWAIEIAIPLCCAFVLGGKERYLAENVKYKLHAVMPEMISASIKTTEKMQGNVRGRWVTEEDEK